MVSRENIIEVLAMSEEDINRILGEDVRYEQFLTKIQKHLKKSNVKVSNDQQTFKEWSDGVIGTSVMVNRFLRNNDIPFEYVKEFDYSFYEKWARSLGY